MNSILVIDDDPLFRTMVVELLKGQGFEVRQAANGREGFDKQVSRPADLVLCDLIMPEMEGQETIMKIHCLSHETPIIAMTGVVDNGPLYLRTAKVLGAARTLAKPFSAEVLVNTIEELLHPALRPAPACQMADT